MEQRLTLVTLGVTDVARSRAFYEGLGFKSSSFRADDVAFFQMGGTVLSIYDRQSLANDIGRADTEAAGFNRVTLAWNARTEREVDTAISEAVKAGATLIKAAEQTSWGGYSGYISDPDGHLWEIAYNPHWPLDEKGTLQLPA